jgi:hypothetical protein
MVKHTCRNTWRRSFRGTLSLSGFLEKESENWNLHWEIGINLYRGTEKQIDVWTLK